MATSPRLNAVTTEAIRQALAVAAAGRLNDACVVGERALVAGGDAAALNAMLGMLRGKLGEHDRAARHLKAAHRANPRDPIIAGNFATALVQLKREHEALAILTEGVLAADRSGQLLKLRAFTAQTLGEFERAITDYDHALSDNPGDWESWNNLGNARRAAGDLDGAVDASARAVDLAPWNAPLRLNYATALEYAGRVEDAEWEYRKMAADFPHDPKPLCELFAMLKTQYRDDEALDAIEEAARRAPGDVELLLGLASHRLTRMRHGAAEEAYRRVLDYDSVNTLAFLGIATVFDLTNRVRELADLVGKAERAKVADDGLSFIRAYHCRRSKRYAEGLEELRKVPDELETARRQQLLGQLLEGVGDFDGAFAAFERMNAIAREDPSDPEGRAAMYRQLVRDQQSMVTTPWRQSWRAAEIDDRPSPAFLVGFPRSGTTLLDTILMSHPGTEVLEEEPTLMRATEALGGIERIPDAADDDVQRARDAYFDSAKSLTPVEPGKLLIDKNPLAMNSVPVIRRLFPDARIIMALRHPCDVVLSCFVTNFKANNAMVSFLTLETAAELYDLSFSFFERSCEVLKPSVHRTRYENLVADLGGEVRPLLNFLGLDWDERILDHQSTALSRGHIKTASYAQVVEPIYKRSAGRWHNYRKHLEPIFPVLRPWVEKFGYEP